MEKMTYERAIEILENNNRVMSSNLSANNPIGCRPIEEISANDTAMIAIQKQIPKKIIFKRKCVFLCPPDCGGPEFDEFGDVPYCPNCEEKLSDDSYDSKVNYCPNCGQKLEY